jgi:trimeric autotransporter adhesin
VSSSTVQKQIAGATLEQNIPNPAGTGTVIRYNIPANIQRAEIIVNDVSGHMIKTYPLTNKGAGQLTISTAQLAGNYFYSLIINGQKAATKQMMISK